MNEVDRTRLEEFRQFKKEIRGSAESRSSHSKSKDLTPDRTVQAQRRKPGER